MKKKYSLMILVILAFILIGCSQTADHPDTTAEPITLYLLTSEVYYNAMGEIGSSFTYTYDENGNRLTYTYEQNGAQTRTEYFYDEAGRLIKQIEYPYNKETFTTYEYTYSRNGRSSVCTGTRSNGIVDSWAKYRYDKNGNVISRKIYQTDANGSKFLHSTVKITYHPNGNKKTETTTFHTKDQIVTKHLNADGQLTEKYTYNGSKKLQVKETYTYDDHGNRITHMVYTEGKKIDDQKSYICNSVYSKNGKILTLTECKTDGTEKQRTIFRFDEKGTVIEEHKYSADGHYLDGYQYFYDDNGNVIKMEYYNVSEEELHHTTVYTYITVQVPAK